MLILILSLSITSETTLSSFLTVLSFKSFNNSFDLGAFALVNMSINNFILAATAANIAQMSDSDLQALATLLAGMPVGEKLADQISFAIFDNDVVTNGNNSYSYPETQKTQAYC